MLMARASREGIQKIRPDKRPFVLSRANYIGGQKYCATWTGDNHSNWTHLRMSIPMVLNLGLSGQPFSGPDLGGFADEADDKLFGRWMGFGALLPFARGHSILGSKDHEPWSFGSETEQICRVALNRRYMLLRYFYTQFYIASRSGIPVMRPLFFVDPVDPDLRNEDRAFTIGADLLVKVNIYENSDGMSAVHIPRNVNWYSLKLDNFVHEELPELKIKAGSIVPIQSAIQHANQTPEHIGIVVALDEKLTATGFVYDDAGDGYEYEHGGFLKTHYTARVESDNVVILLRHEGQYRPLEVPLSIEVMISDNMVWTYTTDNSSTLIKIPIPHHFQS